MAGVDKPVNAVIITHNAHILIRLAYRSFDRIFSALVVS
tara:strand:+ start:3997 stop:4113 length:117 start_codon:yes stop_codon:yes gene_type:complete